MALDLMIVEGYAPDELLLEWAWPLGARELLSSEPHVAQLHRRVQLDSVCAPLYRRATRPHVVDGAGTSMWRLAADLAAGIAPWPAAQPAAAQAAAAQPVNLPRWISLPEDLDKCVESWISSWRSSLIWDLMISFRGDAHPHTLVEIESVEAQLRRCGEEIMYLDDEHIALMKEVLELWTAYGRHMASTDDEVFVADCNIIYLRACLFGSPAYPFERSLLDPHFSVHPSGIYQPQPGRALLEVVDVPSLLSQFQSPLSMPAAQQQAASSGSAEPATPVNGFPLHGADDGDLGGDMSAPEAADEGTRSRRRSWRSTKEASFAEHKDKILREMLIVKGVCYRPTSCNSCQLEIVSAARATGNASSVVADSQADLAASAATSRGDIPGSPATPATPSPAVLFCDDCGMHLCANCDDKEHRLRPLHNRHCLNSMAPLETLQGIELIDEVRCDGKCKWISITETFRTSYCTLGARYLQAGSIPVSTGAVPRPPLP